MLNYKGAYVYDGDTGAELILPSGVQENLYEPLDEMSGGVNFVTDIVGAFDGSDGFYFMNSQGIFHQTWTGSMSEQLLAGELGALSQSSFYSMAVVDSEHLLAAVSNDGRAKGLKFPVESGCAPPDRKQSFASTASGKTVRSARRSSSTKSSTRKS